MCTSRKRHLGVVRPHLFVTKNYCLYDTVGRYRPHNRQRQFQLRSVNVYWISAIFLYAAAFTVVNIDY
jgi:hypothetical protein